MIAHTPSTPAPVVFTDSRGSTSSGMPSPWGWRVFTSAVVLGLVLAVACLAAGLLAYWLLTIAESMRLLPAHVLHNALRTIGIRWAAFVLSITSLLFYGGFFLGVWIVVRRTAGLTWASLGWRAAPLRAYLLVPPVYIATLICAGLALGIEAALVFHGHVAQINNPKNNPQQAVMGAVHHPSVGEFLLLFLAIGIVAPLVEELVFRGMLFQLLRRPLPLWGAVVLSAFVFAALHVIPVLLPTLFLFGVALALVFHYTRSLYCSTFLHALINTVAIVAIVSRP